MTQGTELDFSKNTFVWPIRIYVQHTDMGSIVYHPQYLNFAEQARTEFLRNLGIVYTQLRQETGGMWVVRKCQLRFLKPAILDDALDVRTTLVGLSHTRLKLRQPIYRKETCLVDIELEMAWINAQGKPESMPPVLFEKLNALQ